MIADSWQLRKSSLLGHRAEHCAESPSDPGTQTKREGKRQRKVGEGERRTVSLGNGWRRTNQGDQKIRQRILWKN